MKAYAIGKNAFPTRASLDYSVGPVQQVLEKTGSDALLIISGQDYISSAGRKALIATGVIRASSPGLQSRVEVRRLRRPPSSTPREDTLVQAQS